MLAVLVGLDGLNAPFVLAILWVYGVLLVGVGAGEGSTIVEGSYQAKSQVYDS